MSCCSGTRPSGGVAPAAQCLSTPAFVYYVYIVDDLESRHLRGMVTLRELLTADADASLHDVRPVPDRAGASRSGARHATR
jgi:hypothetical protein